VQRPGAPKRHGAGDISDIFGILHRPRQRARTLAEIEEGIAAGAIGNAPAGARRPKE
jgi:hypothetical protein